MSRGSPLAYTREMGLHPYAIAPIMNKLHSSQRYWVFHRRAVVYRQLNATLIYLYDSLQWR